MRQVYLLIVALFCIAFNYGFSQATLQPTNTVDLLLDDDDDDDDDDEKGTITLAVKVFLQRPYNNGSTNMKVNLTDLLPLQEPYTALGFSDCQNEGTSTTSNILHDYNIVDWVVVEIRGDGDDDDDDDFAEDDDDDEGAMMVGLLTEAGDVVDMDGTSSLVFQDMSGGDYYIIVHHRNHLSVASKMMTLATDGNDDDDDDDDDESGGN